jgi:predicted MPP superfamily phosphohydrolase
VNVVKSVAAAGAAALGWSLIEANWYVLRWATIPSSPPGTAPLRILHLSDLHLLPGQQRKRKFVRESLATGPDMIVVTGDIMGHPDVVDEATDLLGPMAAGRVALFSLGSNDFTGPVFKSPTRYFTRSRVPDDGLRLDTGRLVSGLTDAGWQCVENVRAAVETPIGTLDVLGLGDAHIEHDRPGNWTDNGAAKEPVLRLGVAHAPYLRVLDTYINHAVDVVLSGHTHGGQVRLPGVGALVNNCDLPLRQSRGLSAHTPSMWLHVSAGLGTNRYTPIRFACRPEASILDLVARSDGPG